MKQQKIFILSMLVAAALTLSAMPVAAYANSAKAKHVKKVAAKQKVIFQVSDNDPKKWNLTLNNAKNVQEDLGKDKVDIEIVAYGPGLPMLQLDSEVGGRVQDALDNGVKVVACQNTMSKQKLIQGDMLPNLSYAKAGVVELAQKQAQGYAYIKP